ncbi:MAG: polysaccharide pyruvyl transferase family protein, partial [Promethearchaeota archaeon]
MSKVLITNTNISWNKGSAAQVISTVCSLRKILQNVEYTLLSYFPKLDSKQCSKYNINVIGYSKHKYKTHRTLLLIYSFRLLVTILYCALFSVLAAIHLKSNNALFADKYAKVYSESDLVLDLSGDSFSDWKNISIINMLALLPAILLKKPFILFSQSIGPFNSFTLSFARFCLSKAKLIVIREDVSRQYLERIGIKTKSICLAADCAFLLESAPSSDVLNILKDHNFSKINRPLIGLSASIFMKNHFSKNKTIDYFSVMSKIVDYIIESKNVHVVLIPHVIAPYDWGNDDIYAIQEVRKLVINKRKTLIIDNDLDAKELKGIIGQCDLFIGCRMHANIAALSQNIPTVA